MDAHTLHAATWPTATVHLLTAVIGAGVLALPSALSWLGWTFGMPAIVFFYGVSGQLSSTWISAFIDNGGVKEERRTMTMTIRKSRRG